MSLTFKKHTMILIALSFIVLPFLFAAGIPNEPYDEDFGDIPFVELDETEYAISE